MKRGVCTFVESQPTSTLHSPSIRMKLRLLRSDNLRGKLSNFLQLKSMGVLPTPADTEMKTIHDLIQLYNDWHTA